MNSKRMREFHIFQYAKDSWVVFHPDTRLLFTANTRCASVLESYCSGHSYSSIAAAEHLSQQEVTNLIQELQAFIRKREQSWKPTKPSSQSPQRERRCSKLVLHVSNDCNMRCRYCYGDGGSYGMTRTLMTPALATTTLDRFYAFYDYIGMIQFFGGEPLLNLPTIKAVCEYVRHRALKDPAFAVPSLGIVTNLTILPDEFLSLITTHNIGVTVSLDGPEQINDANRVFRNGQGTFKCVSRNIKRLKEKTQQPGMIEATYTRQHFEHKLSFSALSQYFADAFQVCRLELAEASVPDGNPSKIPPLAYDAIAEDQNTAVSKFITSLNTGIVAPCPNNLVCTLALLTSPSSGFDYHCNAGINSYAVAANGDVFPCQMFVGNDEFRIGNVNDANLLNCRRYRSVRRRFTNTRKALTEACRSCWIRNLCIGCPGKCFLETGTLKVPLITHCGDAQRAVEHLIADLARVRSSNDSWQNLLDALRIPPVRPQVESVPSYTSTSARTMAAV